MTNQRGQIARGVASNPILVGSIILLTIVIGVIISYNADHGLPFVPSYQVIADVPDAAELNAGNSEVRVGGARVGLVKTIDPVLGANGRPAFARLHLSLDKSLEPIPADSTFQVRPRSILGAKYLDLTLGHSRRTLTEGGTLPLSHARSVVELDEAFNTFDKPTTKGIQDTIIGLGNGLAGRGSALNEAVGGAGQLMAPLQRVLATIVSPRSDLPGFLRGGAQFGTALSPVAPTLGLLFDGAATTFAGLDRAGSSLGDSVAQLPPTETVGTRSLSHLGPVLADAAAIVGAIEPGTRVIGDRATRVDSAVRQATPILARTPQLARPLTDTFAALDRLSRRKSTSPSVRELTATVTALGTLLDTLTPAQVHCNVGGLWTRNVSSVLSDGDANGTWLNVLAFVAPTQIFQAATPAADLHANPIPNENADECESGNEPYLPGRQIGNPPGLQQGLDQTAPPAGIGAGR